MQKLILLLLIAFYVSETGTAQNPAAPNERPPRSDSGKKIKAPPPSDSSSVQRQSPEEPRSPGDEDPASPPGAGESSSRDSIMDLSPPKGDDLKHSGAEETGESNSDVGEFKPWNPHKAQKNVEVGDYYAKQKNYSAAISRYREALEYKPKDALATFKLAETLEKVNAYQEARDDYEAYLIILPQGPLAEKARSGIERLKDKSRSRPRLTQSGSTTSPSAQSSQSHR